jgi:hypothetical protein
MFSSHVFSFLTFIWLASHLLPHYAWFEIGHYIQLSLVYLFYITSVVLSFCMFCSMSIVRLCFRGRSQLTLTGTTMEKHTLFSLHSDNLRRDNTLPSIYLHATSRRIHASPVFRFIVITVSIFLMRWILYLHLHSSWHGVNAEVRYLVLPRRKQNKPPRFILQVISLTNTIVNQPTYGCSSRAFPVRGQLAGLVVGVKSCGSDGCRTYRLYERSNLRGVTLCAESPPVAYRVRQLILRKREKDDAIILVFSIH